MGQPYVGEIRLFAGNFAPAGWMFCEGQLLAISENEALFNLVGTTYGGDGANTFGLPDLRGRVPVHQGNGTPLGESGGAENVTITVNQLPSHTHTFAASGDTGTEIDPAGNVLSQSPSVQLYAETAPTVAMNAQAVSAAGGSQPHENMQPYQCINFIISLFGIYPSPT